MQGGREREMRERGGQRLLGWKGCESDSVREAAEALVIESEGPFASAQ